MDDRAEFEQWRQTLGIGRPTYLEVWKAATARQRERDAQIADELYVNHQYTEETIVRYRDDVAEAIRRQP